MLDISMSNIEVGYKLIEQVKSCSLYEYLSGKLGVQVSNTPYLRSRSINYSKAKGFATWIRFVKLSLTFLFLEQFFNWQFIFHRLNFQNPLCKSCSILLIPSCPQQIRMVQIMFPGNVTVRWIIEFWSCLVLLWLWRCVCLCHATFITKSIPKL